jgi:hypothetical protein
MVVRLRNTIPGQPSSGTTAELYIPPGLLEHGAPIGADVRPFAAAGEAQPLPDDPHAARYAAPAVELPALGPSGLPQRAPGSSGITGAAGPETEPEPQSSPWFAAAESEQPEQPAHDQPSDTSSFFTSRERAGKTREESGVDISDMDVLAADLTAPEPDDDDKTDFIYQKMLSEFLVDPKTIAVPQDWKSVWDDGWAAAADVENVPVQAHTEHGLPVRAPGARLVPGGAEPANGKPAVTEPVSPPELPRRDPDAVRAPFSSHFGGVRAARSNAQPPPPENGRDQE